MKVNNTSILKGFRFASNILEAPSPNKIKKLTFSVTNLCNCRCMMCNIWEKYKKNKALINGEMKLEQIKKIFLDSMVLRNVEKISFTGGEPFLRSDFTDLFLFFYGRYPNSIFDITSNGQNPALIRKSMAKIISAIDASRLNVLVSLDGLKDTHDKIRGRAGAFELAEETLNLVRELSSSARLIISHTIGPWNYRELLDVYDYARSREITMTMRFADLQNSFFYNLNGNRNGWKDKELSEAERQVSMVIKEIQRKRSLPGKAINPDIFFFSKMADYILNPRRIQKCYSGTHSLFMDPYGMIYPCISLDKCIGNALENGFDSVWNSIKASEIRKSIAAEKCHCWTDCEVYPSIQRHFDYIAFNLKELIRSRFNSRSLKGKRG